MWAERTHNTFLQLQRNSRIFSIKKSLQMRLGISIPFSVLITSSRQNMFIPHHHYIICIACFYSYIFCQEEITVNKLRIQRDPISFGWQPLFLNHPFWYFPCQVIQYAILSCTTQREVLAFTKFSVSPTALTYTQFCMENPCLSPLKYQVTRDPAEQLKKRNLKW